LTRGDWKKIFHSLGRSPYFVTFSGGEPFLRADIADIAHDLYTICRPKILVIPTNGILTEKIQEDIRKMLASCPKLHLTVNLSLDGVGEKHDKIRGVPGNFGKAIETYKSLKKIKAKNFTLGVHTVISKANISDFPVLCNFVLDKLRPDSYITEIAENRVELGIMSKDITPNPADYEKAIDYLKKKLKEKKWAGLPQLTQAFRFFYYSLVPKTLMKKTQVIPCYAGFASAQIAPSGDVWPCCVRADVLVNLKEENFDFRKIWFSKKARQVRKSIKNRQCACPLANVSYINILLSPKAMCRVVFNLLQ